MSSVLEALRKSELERQMASGQTTSILYPVMVEQKRGGKMTILWVAAAGLVAVVLIWWLWERSHAPNISVAADKTIVMTTPPLTVPTGPVVLPVQKDKSATTVNRTAVKKGEIQAKAPSSPVQMNTVEADKTEPVVGQLHMDLPALVIAGYIRDEQGAALAMINDKLVREGEEVAPGLRLEKILSDGSIFSYKGQRFRR